MEMTLEDLFTFAQAFADLGTAVQEQAVTVLEGGGNSYNLNPNALTLIEERLLRTIPDPEMREELLELLQDARRNIEEDDAELEE
jgi:hypothetical protein